MEKTLTLQQLPPEIIYNILSFLPSSDVTTIASFYCRILRSWTLVLLDERAQQSMLLGWRLMLGATTTKPPLHDGDKKYEQDKEFVCEYKTIDPWTLDIYFTVRAFGKDGFCSLVDDTTFDRHSSPPPEDQPPPPHRRCQEEEIKIPFGSASTRVLASVLKERVPTKLLEFATTLPDEYSFTVHADDYQQLRSTMGLEKVAALQPEFKVKYHIYPSSDDDDDHPIGNPPDALPDDGPTTPPPSSSAQPAMTPGIALRIDSLQLNPYWWWSQLDRHHYASFIGLEHRFW